MKLYVPLLIALLSVPSFAQTETDSAADDADAAMAQRMGTVFFSDEGMTTMRPATEIQGQFMAMSAEDQSGLRARCEVIAEAKAAMEPSKSDGTAGTDAATGTEMANDSSGTTNVEDLGFMGDTVRMQPICDMIKTF